MFDVVRTAKTNFLETRLILFYITQTCPCNILQYFTAIKMIIIHPILLSNQSAPVASGDFKIKSHIRTAARHTSLLTK